MPTALKKLEKESASLGSAAMAANWSCQSARYRLARASISCGLSDMRAVYASARCTCQKGVGARQKGVGARASALHCNSLRCGAKKILARRSIWRNSARRTAVYDIREPINKASRRTMAEVAKDGESVITIKKYANRRLYNTATSSYVTLDDLCQLVKEKQDFVVYDAKTNEDITRSVLTQIIVEEESKGQNLLPIGFLRQLISLYGDNLQSLVPRYLDHSMRNFTRNQEQMQSYLQNAFDGLFPFGSLDDMGKQNTELFDQAMRMFLTPDGDAQDNGGDSPQAAAGPATQNAPDDDQTLAAIQNQIDALQKQLAALITKKTE